MNFIDYVRESSAKDEQIAALSRELASARACHILCADALDIAREEIEGLRAQLSRARRGLVPMYNSIPISELMRATPGLVSDFPAGDGGTTVDPRSLALSRALSLPTVPDATGR